MVNFSGHVSSRVLIIMEFNGDVQFPASRPRFRKCKVRTTSLSIPTSPTTSVSPVEVSPHASLVFNEAGHAFVHEDYRFSRRIYESPGSPGIVDLYCHATSGHQIIIKRNLKHKMNSQVQSTSAHRELSLHRELIHRHIVHLLDSGENEHEILLAMEFIEDYDYFRNRLEVYNKPFYLKSDGGIEKLKSISFDILTALSYLHESKIIHLDIKPGNILFDRRVDESEYPIAKLCDFGLSRRVEVEGVAYIEKRCGTEPYIAPEVRDQCHVTSAVDMWSFGILLYQLTVGFVPNALRWKPGEPVPFVPRYWKKYANTGLPDLISRCLYLNPCDRITSSSALHHPWFSI